MNWLSQSFSRLSRGLFFTMAAKVVDSLHDNFQWPWWYLSRLPPRAREHAASRLRGLSVSTAFSGICSPTTSLFIIMLVHSQYFANDCKLITEPSGAPTFDYVAATEWSPECMIELQCLHHPPRFLFKHVLDFATPATLNSYQTMMTAGTLTWRKLQTLVMSPGAVRKSATCHRTGAIAEHPWSWISIGGHPCTDYSSQGSLKKEDGQTAFFFLVWAALQLMLLPIVIVSENVPNYPERNLHDMFGNLYRVSSVVLSNLDLGSSGSRSRRFTVMVLKSKAALTIPLKLVVSHFRRRVGQHSFNDFCVAGTAELSAEVQWASSRDSSAAQTLCAGSSPDFRQCLTPLEERHLSRYEAMCKTSSHHGHVFSLQQDPHCRPTMSKGANLQTIIAETGVMWHSSLRRWLTARELLAHGFCGIYAAPADLPSGASHI